MIPLCLSLPCCCGCQARNYLKALDPKNAASLDIIESALFVISLDDETSHDIETLARATLHGNGHNKWFDKPMNLVVFKNGRAGLNGEVGGSGRWRCPVCVAGVARACALLVPTHATVCIAFA